jgi:hypothetical protein
MFLEIVAPEAILLIEETLRIELFSCTETLDQCFYLMPNVVC